MGDTDKITISRNRERAQILGSTAKLSKNQSELLNDNIFGSKLNTNDTRSSRSFLTTLISVSKEGNGHNLNESHCDPDHMVELCWLYTQVYCRP